MLYLDRAEVASLLPNERARSAGARLRGGRRDGFLTVAGICCGLYIHALLSALGVSAVVAHSAAAFTAMKIAGACYLAWLGLQSLRSGLVLSKSLLLATIHFAEGVVWIGLVAILVALGARLALDRA